MDITCCTNDKCMQAEECLRYRTVWHPRQSVTSFAAEGCESFMLIQAHDAIVPLVEADNRVSIVENTVPTSAAAQREHEEAVTAWAAEIDTAVRDRWE